MPTYLIVLTQCMSRWVRTIRTILKNSSDPYDNIVLCVARHVLWDIWIGGLVELSIWLSAVLRRQTLSEMLEACQCPRARKESKKSGPGAGEERRGPEAQPPHAPNSETDPALISAITEDCISGKPCPHPLQRDVVNSGERSSWEGTVFCLPNNFISPHVKEQRQIF